MVGAYQHSYLVTKMEYIGFFMAYQVTVYGRGVLSSRITV